MRTDIAAEPERKLNAISTKDVLRFFFLVFGDQQVAEELTIRAFLRNQHNEDNSQVSVLKHAYALAIRELRQESDNEHRAGFTTVLSRTDRILMALYAGLRLDMATIAEIAELPKSVVSSRCMQAAKLLRRTIELSSAGGFVRVPASGYEANL